MVPPMRIRVFAITTFYDNHEKTLSKHHGRDAFA
jgi:hypothetical protein